ncbi:heme lyase NrfEFG subunit NrfF [Shewanella waksmanii]|uniref:heme lyase NrfEFG subunit NrfF n=1 Tax=Shewanella waksmanii TaxID=213783 RepID=UPI0037370332
MRAIFALLSVMLLSLALTMSAHATPVDTYEFQSMEHQKRALDLAHSLRCPQCQNQNLIDSNSPVAQDLRLEVYEMVDAGKNDAEIIEFMTSRYGDFVLYKPRFEFKTMVLWLGPIILMLFALAFVFMLVRKQRGSVTDNITISDADQAELDKLLKRKNDE